MGKKKSSLSRALQNAQEQKQRAQKEEAKKLNQQQKQPKHLNNSNANKPNAQRPVPVARVQQKSRPTTDTHSHDAHHEKKYLDCEPTTTQRNDIELPEASCQTTAPDVDIGSHSIGHSVDQHKSHTKPRLSMVNKNDQVLLVGEGLSFDKIWREEKRLTNYTIKQGISRLPSRFWLSIHIQGTSLPPPPSIPKKRC
jgi:hypothetical protein